MILRLLILRFLRRRLADKKNERREQVDVVDRNELHRWLTDLRRQLLVQI